MFLSFYLGYALNLFSQSFLEQHRIKLLFVIIWLHISALDLFYVTYRGPVFLWQENVQLQTLVAHVLIALATIGLYCFISKRKSTNPKTQKNN